MTATPKPRAGEHTKGPHITKFGSIKEEGGKFIFNDFEVNCEGGQIGVLSSFMTRLIVMRLLTNLEQEFTAERDLLRERERELVEALRELYQSVPAAQAPFPNDEMVPSAHWLAEEKTRALLAKHGR